MKVKNSIQKNIEKWARKKRNRIGISILKEKPAILASFRKAQKIVDIIIYSNHSIKGFKTRVLPNESAISQALIEDYKNEKIDQMIRGQVDDFSFTEKFKKQFSIPLKKKRLAFPLLEDVWGNQFFLVVCSNPEGQNLKDKLRITSGAVDWIKQEFNLTPRLAVMATCRPESVGKDPLMTKSYREAEAVVKFFKKKGIVAKNIHIELQKAIPWANLIMAANGTIGNQIFRALVLLGKGKTIIAPTIFPGGRTYCDNSRNETNFYNHFLFASALANKKKNKKKA